MIRLQKLELVFEWTEDGRTDGRGSRNSYLDFSGPDDLGLDNRSEIVELG